MPLDYRTEVFVITHDLIQLVETLTRIPDNFIHHRNILNISLTSYPDNINVTANASLGKSDHNHISAACLFKALRNKSHNFSPSIALYQCRLGQITLLRDPFPIGGFIKLRRKS